MMGPLRFSESLVRLGSTGIFLFLAACTKQPERPEIPHYPPLPVEQVILHERITPGDVRELFRAVNQDGKLDGLKPYLEVPSDATLGELGDLAVRYLYDDAQTATGLLALLSGRNQNRSFSTLHRALEREATQPGFSDSREFFVRLLSLEQLPSVISRDKGLLEPGRAGILSSLWSPGEDPYSESRKRDPVEVPAEAIIADLGKALNDGALKTKVETLIGALAEKDFGSSALRALSLARKETKSKAFEGFGYGFGALTKADKLERVFDLVRSLDSASGGLFEEAQEKLKADDTASQLASFLQPNIAGAISALIREGLGKMPVKDYVDRFTAIRTGVVQITGVARPDDASDMLIFNLPIYLNTYVLEKWLSALTADPANTALAGKIAKGDLSGEIWDLPVAVPAFEINLIVKKKTKEAEFYALQDKVIADLKGLGLDTFAALLNDAVRKEGIGDFRYVFEASAQKKKLREALADAVRVADSVRPFADPSAAARTLIQVFTRSDLGAPFILSSFETPSLMTSLNRLVAFVGRDRWPDLRRALFEDFGLGKLDDKQRDAILSLYREKPELKEKARQLLDRLPALTDFDQSFDGLPSPFSLYVRLLEALPSKDPSSATALLRFVASSGVLSKTDDKPNYPAVFQLAASGRPASRALYALGGVPSRDRWALLDLINEMFGAEGSPSGTSLHWSVGAKLIASEPKGAANWLRRMMSADAGTFGEVPAISDDELRWVKRLVDRGDHAPLIRFLRDHGSRSELRRLTAELAQVSRSGYLKDALRLLLQVRNERIQAIARTLLFWDESGELREFLAVTELLLASDTKPNS